MGWSTEKIEQSFSKDKQGKAIADGDHWKAYSLVAKGIDRYFPVNKASLDRIVSILFSWDHAVILKQVWGETCIAIDWSQP
jgi:hypothetical protein